MEEKLTEKLIQTVTYLISYQKRKTSINKTNNAMRRGFLDTNAWLITGTVRSANNEREMPLVAKWLREVRTGFGIHNLCTVPTEYISTAI